MRRVSRNVLQQRMLNFSRYREVHCVGVQGAVGTVDPDAPWAHVAVVVELIAESAAIYERECAGGAGDNATFRWRQSQRVADNEVAPVMIIVCFLPDAGYEVGECTSE